MTQPRAVGTEPTRQASYRRMRTARLLAPLALAVVFAAACGSSREPVRSAPTAAQSHPVRPRAATITTATMAEPGFTAHYVGPIAHDYSEPNTGFSLTVPPPDAKPTISWQQAVTACFSGAGICDKAAGAGNITVALAIGYNPQPGDMLADGSINPVMNHNLVYVLAQPLGPCVPTGRAGSTSAPPTSASCMALSFVDAHTGKGAPAISGPSIRDPASA